jgi:hypothetical protein
MDKILNTKQVKSIVDKLKEEGFIRNFLSENKYSFQRKRNNILDHCLVCENGHQGSEPFVGFSSCKIFKNSSPSLIATSAESVESFYCFYITKNMNFKEIVEKRRGQIERKEDYGT